MTSSQPDLSTHVIPLGTPLSALQAQEAFAGLSAREKRYCHYLARAAWEGAPICLLQTSPESVPVFLLLREVFFTNMGNYKGFGDTKIIPGIPKVPAIFNQFSAPTIKGGKVGCNKSTTM